MMAGLSCLEKVGVGVGAEMGNLHNQKTAAIPWCVEGQSPTTQLVGQLSWHVAQGATTCAADCSSQPTPQLHTAHPEVPQLALCITDVEGHLAATSQHLRKQHAQPPHTSAVARSNVR